MSRARRRMSLLDSTFLRMETAESPMHVASLQTFQIPDGAPADFVRDIVTAFRSPGPLTKPFGLTLSGGPLSRVTPSLEQADSVDLDYHVRHTALPAPGRERELGELVSHLHGVALDRSRPLWTCHVIEGLEGNRFAVYVKVHHALTDGVGGMRLMTQSLATERDGVWCAPWHYEKTRSPRSDSSRSLTVGLKPAVTTALSLGRGVAGLLRHSGAEPVRVSFEAPGSAHPTRPRARRGRPRHRRRCAGDAERCLGSR
jgi:diacylglycerol O-acyltransferase